MLIVLAAVLLLTVVLVDAPVRTLSKSFDPSVRTLLVFVTGFGNSSWPIGLGLLLLGLSAMLRRSEMGPPAADLQGFRAMLILLVSSVVVSGVLASLSKHMIGRARPSADLEVMVLEFSFMAFETGWASFPSGHATTATAAAVALAICFQRQAWALLAIGLLAAISRALLGVHWLSDCLAGIVLGGITTILMHRRMIVAGYIPENGTKALSSMAAATLRVLRSFARQSVGHLATIKSGIAIFNGRR